MGAGLASYGPLDYLLGALLSLWPVAQVLVPTLALAWSQPRRARFGRRLALVVAVGAAGALALNSAAYLSGGGGSRAWSFASSVLVIAYAALAATFLFEASAWQAAFCASAGYAVQNLSSGTQELFALLGERVLSCDLVPVHADLAAGPVVAQVNAPAFVLGLAIYGCCLVVFLASFVRAVRRRGLSRMEDRGMLAVMLLVVLAVIAFDVVIKSLADQGAPLADLLLLRAVHASVCLFVLFVSYEMLYSRSLELEVATRDHLEAERGRQYAQSRQAIAAINARVHDIRHDVLRTLAAADPHADRDLLASVARQIDVYDTTVRTGNEVLDTVLTQKGLVCRQEGVTLSCVADGSALDALSPSETYELVATILDNATAASREIADRSRRTVSLVIRRHGTLATIREENLYDPAGAGGYDLSPVRAIAAAHGGTVVADRRDGTFSLTVML